MTFFAFDQKHMMIAGAVVLAIVVVLAFILGRRDSLLQLAPKPILTVNETEFFRRMQKALPDFLIFPQVSMGALMKPAVSDPKLYSRIRGTFAQKIVDYVICDSSTLAVVAIVELDDRTHDVQKDARRDRITAAAGYRTIRWPSKNRPSSEDIRKTVLSLVKA